MSQRGAVRNSWGGAQRIGQMRVAHAPGRCLPNPLTNFLQHVDRGLVVGDGAHQVAATRLGDAADLEGAGERVVLL